eukprot:7381407-Prymnesium_polylepis.1
MPWRPLPTYSLHPLHFSITLNFTVPYETSHQFTRSLITRAPRPPVHRTIGHRIGISDGDARDEEPQSQSLDLRERVASVGRSRRATPVPRPRLSINWDNSSWHLRPGLRVLRDKPRSTKLSPSRARRVAKLSQLSLFMIAALPSISCRAPAQRHARTRGRAPRGICRRRVATTCAR